jgi:hypothetical protein
VLVDIAKQYIKFIDYLQFSTDNVEAGMQIQSQKETIKPDTTNWANLAVPEAQEASVKGKESHVRRREQSKVTKEGTIDWIYAGKMEDDDQAQPQNRIVQW